MKVNVRSWLPLFIWVILIFGLSSIPALSNDHPGLPVHFDKVAHLIEYMILAIFFCRGLYRDRKIDRILICLFVILCGAGIAVMDESYQRWIPGRNSSVMDLLADVAGVMVGTLIALFRYGRATEKVEGV